MANVQRVQLARKGTLWGRIKKNHWVYVFIVPCLLHLIIFSYFPIYGITLAFKDYHFNKGIVGSPWSDPIFKNFLSIKNDPLFWNAFWNTFRVGFFYILTSFPAPIILAIILNEVKTSTLSARFRPYLPFRTSYLGSWSVASWSTSLHLRGLSIISWQSSASHVAISWQIASLSDQCFI